ncbi:PKD domain-containing protein [Pedobacter sp. NJ-S-72]
MGNCQPDDVEQDVCVQDPPKPGFDLGNPLICLTPGTLTPTNTTILDNTCPAATPAYTWKVSPSTGVTFAPNSKTPQFKFTQTGIYSVTLTVQSGTCSVTTTPQKIVVNTQPQASLSPDVILCATGNYTFNPTAALPNPQLAELPMKSTELITGQLAEVITLLSLLMVPPQNIRLSTLLIMLLTRSH